MGITCRAPSYGRSSPPAAALSGAPCSTTPRALWCCLRRLQAYGAATDPARLALGGSSFGGICTLWACMAYPGRFGAALVESPSLWVAQERFLR